MQIRNQHNAREQVQHWWSDIHQYLGLFFEVMMDNRTITELEIDPAKQYLADRYAYLSNLHSPLEIQVIHNQLLESIQHLQQSIDYQRKGDLLNARSRYQMAQNTLDSVRLSLLRYRIML